MSKTKDFLLTAAVAAMVFTLSCSSDDGREDGSVSSSSVGGEQGGGLSSSSFSSTCSGNDNTSTHYCSNGTMKAYGFVTHGEQTYKTVVIGNQTWFAENLNYTVEGSKCYGEGGTTYIYDEETDDYIERTYSLAEVQANCVKYGRLYDWSMAMGLPSSCNSNSCSSQIPSPHRGICPSGWHIPSNADWDKLFRYADGTNGTSSPYTSFTAGKHLKSANGWIPYSSIENLDTYGFSALPSGSYSDGHFYGVGNGHDEGFWWSASEYRRSGYAEIKEMEYNNDHAVSFDSDKSSFGSVRCVQDGDDVPSSSSSVGYTGSYGSEYYEGQTYKTVAIGTQTWMAENLNYAVEGSKCYGEDGTIYDEEIDGYVEKTLSEAEVQANCATYGRLYDWSTAMGLASSCNSSSCSIQPKHRGICPAGWHIPSHAEWDTLITSTGSFSTAGTKLKAVSGWSNGNGTNDYGFSALPGGFGFLSGYSCNVDVGCYDYRWSFYDVGDIGFWWSASESEDGSDYAYGRYMGYFNDRADLYDGPKDDMYSVRCVHD